MSNQMQDIEHIHQQELEEFKELKELKEFKENNNELEIVLKPFYQLQTYNDILDKINSDKDLCLKELYKSTVFQINTIRIIQQKYTDPTLPTVEKIFSKWGGKPGLGGNSNDLKIKKMTAFEIIHRYYHYNQKYVFEALKDLCNFTQFYDHNIENYVMLD